MSPDPDWVTDDEQAETGGTDSGAELALTVVQYTDGPDRCTVYPPGLSGVARMSTWLTADREAFVPLEDMR